MPRSGTTLVVSLLNMQHNTIALAEPIELDMKCDRQQAFEEVQQFLEETRRGARAQQPVITKHVGGKLISNFVEPPNDEKRLRRTRAQRSALCFDKPLTEDFTLVVKQPAEFTALADLLVDRFPLYAVVRDPLAVMAAWQTVNMPVNRGRMPRAEALAPDLKRRLNETEDRVVRQAALIEWQLRTYLTLPPGRVIRYEDVVACPTAEIAKLAPAASEVFSLAAYDPVDRYRGVDFRSLAAALAPIRPLIEQFYPDFQRAWAARLPWLSFS
jgi:hypothetical protein